MMTHDFGSPKERRRALESLTKEMYGPKPNPDRPSEPEDAVEKLYEFEKQEDHSVGLIGLIVFFGIGSIVLLMWGAPSGFILTGVLFACIAWYAVEHTREKRRADALARKAAQRSAEP